MAENLEQYRDLYEMVKNPAKAELFGDAGLFGGPGEENHEVLELFAEWIDQEERKNTGLIPPSINSKNFIKFLKSDGKGEENEKLIEKIKDLHQRGIIRDGSSKNNTLRRFAVILDALDVFNNKKRATNEYNIALKNVGLLQPLKTSQPKKTEEKTEEKKTATPTPIISGNKEEKDKEPKATDKKETIDKEREAKETEAKETEAKATSESGEKKGSDRFKVSIDDTNKTDLTIKASAKNKIPTETLRKSPEVTKQSTTPALQKTDATSSMIPGKTAIPGKIAIPGTAQGSKKPHDLPSFTEAKPATGTRPLPQTTISLAPHAGQRNVRRIPGHSGGQAMRMKSPAKETPQRIQDQNPQANRQQTAQGGTPSSQTSRFSNNQPNRSTRSGQLAQQGGSKGSSLPATVAKRALAGFGVGAGLLLSPNTGDTATFAISHASTVFKSITTLIHLLLK